MASLDKTLGWGQYARQVEAALKEKNVVTKTLVMPYRRSLFFWAAQVFRARRALKDCDILHALDAFPWGVVGALATLGTKKPLFLSALGTYAVAPLAHRPTRVLLAWAYRRAERIFCISEFTSREIRRFLNLSNLQVVPLGVGKEWLPTREVLRRPDPLILSVGAVKYRKGYHISIPAVARLIPEFPNLKYVIVGDQSDTRYKEHLERLIREHRGEGHTEFHSVLPDGELRELYQHARVFVLTPITEKYHFEGFGLVYLEANASGTPVVGTRNSGAEEPIRDGESGFLVEQNDIEGTAAAIRKLLAEKTLWEKMSERAKVHAKEMTWEKTVGAYIREYEKVLPKGR